MAAPWPRCQHVQNGTTHPTCIQLGIQNKSNKTIFLCSSPIYKISGLLGPLKLLQASPESRGLLTLTPVRHWASSTISSSRAQHQQRPPRGGWRAPSGSLSYQASSFLAGCWEWVETEIRVAPFSPLFLAKLASLFPYVTQILSEIKELDPSHLYGLWGSKLLGTVSANSKSFCSVFQLLNEHVLFLLCLCSPLPSPLPLPCRSKPQSVHQLRWEVLCHYGGRRNGYVAHSLTVFSLPFSSLDSSPPPSWIELWRIQIPLLYHTAFLSLKPWSQPTPSLGPYPLPQEGLSSHSL